MDIRVPRLGEGADSGSVVSIFVKEGDTIKKDQPILDLENEKAVATIPSLGAGTITKVRVKVGDKVSVGQILVSLAEEGAPAVKGEGASAADMSFRASEATEKSRGISATTGFLGRRGDLEMTEGDYVYQSTSGLPPPASPSVRKVAQELSIDLTRVRGSERGGRIVMADLKTHIQKPQNVHSRSVQRTGEAVDFSKWGKVTKKPMSSLRQKIAEKMTESWQTIPHVTQFDEADITRLMALRKKYAPAYEKKGARLTLTLFAMKTVVEALKKYPIFNSSLDESTHEIVTKEYYHLGVAVDTPEGLLVPVLRDVDKKNIFEISKELEELAEKTRKRKVSLDELKGGTFTISNLGGIGGTHFTPLINKPEVAILGLGRAKENFQKKQMLPVALSYDHRVIDGADGARFIRAVVEAFENFNEKELSSF